MSVQQQAKAKRRQMRNGYAHMSGSLSRPTIAGKSYSTVSESISRARAAAAAEMRRRKK